MLRLYITPDGQAPYLLSFERAHISVGAAEDNDVRLQAAGVSGRQFRLRCEAAGVVLEDSGSRNGTYVNNRKVSGSQVVVPGDEIRVVGFRLKVTSTDAAVATGAPAGEAGGAAAGGTTAQMALGGTMAAAAEQEPPPGFDAPRVAALVVPRARAFHERGDADHLLRGEELHDAATWVACGSRVTPTAERREQELVAASRTAAKLRGRRRMGVLAAYVVAVVAGGWTARSVLAGGPEAYAGRLGRQLRAIAAEVEVKKRKLCVDESRRHADAAAAEAKSAPESALRQAVAGLECVAGFPELRDTPAEDVARTLLASAHGQVVDRGAAVTKVVADAHGKTVAWGREDGSVMVWDVARAEGTPSEGAGPARLLEISDNGERLVALAGGQVQVWNLLDPAAATRRIALDGKAGEAGAAGLSGDGRLLVAAAGAELRAYHVDSPGARLAGMVLPGVEVARHVVVVADGTRVFAASGSTVTGWKVTTRKVEKPTTYPGHAAVVSALALARCGDEKAERWLLSADSAGEVHAVDLRARGKVKPVVLRAEGQPIGAVRMGPDCRTVVGATARTLEVWDLQAAEPARTRRTIAVGGPISDIAFDGDGDRVVVATAAELAVCELHASEPCGERTGHSKPIVGMDLAPGPGRAITAGADGTVRLWDVRATTGAGSLQAHPREAVRALAVGVDNRVLSASGADATLWRLAGVGAPMAVAELVGGTGQPLRAVALSPNPMWAATAADESALMIWRLGADGARASAQPVATTGKLSRLAFSDDGLWLAGVGPGAACAVQMNAAGQHTCAPMAVQGEHSAVVFLPGTHRVAVGGVDRGVALHDLDALVKSTGARHEDLGKGTGAVKVLTVSGDGRWLAAGGESADGRLWDLTAAPLAAQKLGGLEDTVVALAFSADGRWLAAGAGRKIYAWDLQAFTSPPLRVIEGHASSLRALAFSGDGALISAGNDGKILAWRIEEAEPKPRSLGAHRELVAHLGVLSDGDFVVSAGAEPTLHFWPLTARPLWEMARQVLGPE